MCKIYIECTSLDGLPIIKNANTLQKDLQRDAGLLNAAYQSDSLADDLGEVYKYIMLQCCIE